MSTPSDTPEDWYPGAGSRHGHPEGFEPTEVPAIPTFAPLAHHFAPSDYDRLAEALPELERINGISRDWLEWYEGLTVRMGRATGAVEPDPTD